MANKPRSLISLQQDVILSTRSFYISWHCCLFFFYLYSQLHAGETIDFLLRTKFQLYPQFYSEDFLITPFLFSYFPVLYKNVSASLSGAQIQQNGIGRNMGQMIAKWTATSSQQRWVTWPCSKRWSMLPSFFCSVNSRMINDLQEFSNNRPTPGAL